MARLSAAFGSATLHAMPPEFGRKWGTKSLNSRFPLPTLLCLLIKDNIWVNELHSNKGEGM